MSAALLLLSSFSSSPVRVRAGPGAARAKVRGRAGILSRAGAARRGRAWAPLGFRLPRTPAGGSVPSRRAAGREGPALRKLGSFAATFLTAKREGGGAGPILELPLTAEVARRAGARCEGSACRAGIGPNVGSTDIAARAFRRALRSFLNSRFRYLRTALPE